MFDRTYRQRLETDLARWESDGVVTPAAASAIRAALPQLAPGVTIAVVIAIVGSLLIAAAFLAFVAAHWTELARLHYRYADKELEIAVPRSLLGLKGDSFSFDFKWADNPTDLKDPISLCTSGDTAPNRRFNYRCLWRK